MEAPGGHQPSPSALHLRRDGRLDWDSVRGQIGLFHGWSRLAEQTTRARHEPEKYRSTRHDLPATRPLLLWGPDCWQVMGSTNFLLAITFFQVASPGAPNHNSPLAVLSAWPPRSSLSSLPGPGCGLLLAWSSLLSMVAAAFSSLALLSPPGDRTGQTCHFPPGVHCQRGEASPLGTCRCFTGLFFTTTEAVRAQPSPQ